CPSEQKQAREIIDIVGKDGVLTVGDTSGFIESGGVINFMLEENKIRFDINLTAAEKTGLKIRSQLLRLAKKVFKDGPDATRP
ncbi:MAG: YfiR family protein, partial [Sedimentisphaerales bacterium]|nr:YfiR family protein [Sedimentisphaerales bacterium]